jgi:hypothetical protein
MLFNRTYRQQLKLAKAVEAMREEIARLNSRSQTFVVIVNHCERLVREKETLLRLVQANQYMMGADR